MPRFVRNLLRGALVLAMALALGLLPLGGGAAVAGDSAASYDAAHEVAYDGMGCGGMAF